MKTYRKLFACALLWCAPALSADSAIGDFNMDGAIDTADLDSLTAEVRVGTSQPKFDLNGDSVVDFGDRLIWVHEVKHTWFGDSNLDGEFNSGDFVAVFAAGKYETGSQARWADGDWSGDGFFDSSDFITAFTDGGYELGPPPVATVPEPSTISLLIMSASILAISLRRIAVSR
ncbi:MAG: PEP-CTERM sorting domain-containing protein [Planctomycetales bacterium]|nr:PEP-CTERM sorting domain-containing protein [Planctomycetales bacterium]